MNASTINKIFSSVGFDKKFTARETSKIPTGIGFVAEDGKTKAHPTQEGYDILMNYATINPTFVTSIRKLGEGINAFLNAQKGKVVTLNFDILDEYDLINSVGDMKISTKRRSRSPLLKKDSPKRKSKSPPVLKKDSPKRKSKKPKKDSPENSPKRRSPPRDMPKKTKEHSPSLTDQFDNLTISKVNRTVDDKNSISAIYASDTLQNWTTASIINYLISEADITAVLKCVMSELESSQIKGKDEKIKEILNLLGSSSDKHSFGAANHQSKRRVSKRTGRTRRVSKRTKRTRRVSKRTRRTRRVSKRTRRTRRVSKRTRRTRRVSKRTKRTKRTRVSRRVSIKKRS